MAKNSGVGERSLISESDDIGLNAHLAGCSSVTLGVFVNHSKLQFPYTGMKWEY